MPLRCEEHAMKQRLNNYVETKMTEALLRECPSCKRKFVKADGCNKMVIYIFFYFKCFFCSISFKKVLFYRYVHVEQSCVTYAGKKSKTIAIFLIYRLMVLPKILQTNPVRLILRNAHCTRTRRKCTRMKSLKVLPELELNSPLPIQIFALI